MESQKSGIEHEDQLQSSSLQDQAVRLGPTRPLADQQPAASVAGVPVVVRFPDRLLKGFLMSEPGTLGLEDGTTALNDFRRDRGGPTERVALAGAKAIFFVKSFTGRSSHRDLHFQDELPPTARLYVRLIFLDEERMEGIVDNELDLLTKEGFFLEPVDPDSNNARVYVFKNQIRDFRILALRRPSEVSFSRQSRS